MATQNEQFSLSGFLFSGMFLSAILAIKFGLFCLGQPDDQLASKLAAQNFRPPFESIHLPQTLVAGSDRNRLLDGLVERRIFPLGMNDSVNIVGILNGEPRSAEENIGVPDLVELMKRSVSEATHPKRCTK